MKRIRISDTTLASANAGFSFKEKLEIARQLEKLGVDRIELPAIENLKTDVLFVKTVSSFVKNAELSVAAGKTLESVENAAAALSRAEKGSIRIELPVSTVGMEYSCHLKPAKMLEWIEKTVTAAVKTGFSVEFCAVDATRAEPEFLISAIKSAVAAGASCVSVLDSASTMLPEEFAEFVAVIVNNTDLPVGVGCPDLNGFACAEAIMAVRRGVDTVKTSVGNETVNLEKFAQMIENCGERGGFSSGIRYTEMHRIMHQIKWILDARASGEKSGAAVPNADVNVRMDGKDSFETVMETVAKLGYDLNEEDQKKVFEEFGRVAAKKNVGHKELEAIVASVALQVPATYVLKSYVINNGNIISSSAQITLDDNGRELKGISMGDGPIDAAFLAIEQIIGHHYELDDFQIQSVTQGKEAMGSALVKLRSNGRVYSGNGISTDIIGASIRAYVSAINKIAYEENA